jgi:hypothetical protein
VASDLVQRALLFELDGDLSDAILGGTCSLKIEFRFLNGYLIVPGGPSAYPRVDDQRQPIKPLEVLMKRYLGVVAAAALLVGTMAVATDALAAGHGGGGFGGGHMGGGFRGPLLESVPSSRVGPGNFTPSLSQIRT